MLANFENSHFGSTLFGTSASTFAGSRFGANTSLFTGSRFANPFENRFGSMTFGHTGFNRFAPNIPHVFNGTFGFNNFAFNRFAFNNFFFDRFFSNTFFFNRFGFFPAFDFFFFPRRNFFFFDFAFSPSFGFFGSPWWWGQGWWGPGWASWDSSWGWGWPPPPPPRWGSNVYNSYPGLSGSPSSDNSENLSAGTETEGSRNTNPTTGNVAVSTPSILLYLKDGTMYAASDYWFAGGKLHFIVNYEGERTVGMEELDLQRTVDENAKRGVPFTLKPKPNSSDATPSKDGNPPGDSALGNTGTDQNKSVPAISPIATHPPAPQIESTSQPQVQF